MAKKKNELPKNEIELPESENIELTQKQYNFCKYYILHYNGSKAYKLAYEDVTDETARVNASKLLTNTNIKKQIEYLKANLAETAEISPLMILNEYKKIAFSSIAHMHNTWVERKEFEALTDEQKECIQEIETKIIRKVYKELNPDSGEFDNVPYDIEYVKIKLYNKLDGLKSINQMLGWDAPAKIDLSSLGEKIELTIIPASNFKNENSNAEQI